MDLDTPVGSAGPYLFNAGKDFPSSNLQYIYPCATYTEDIFFIFAYLKNINTHKVNSKTSVTAGNRLITYQIYN